MTAIRPETVSTYTDKQLRRAMKHGHDDGWNFDCTECYLKEDAEKEVAKRAAPAKDRARAMSRPSRHDPRASRRAKRKKPASIDEQVAVEFAQYLTASGKFGERLGRWIVTTAAWGRLGQTLRSAVDVAVLWGLSNFIIRGGATTTKVSQQAIADRAHVHRVTASRTIQYLYDVGLVDLPDLQEGEKPDWLKRLRYRLVPPKEWPTKLYDEMRATIRDEKKAVEEARRNAKRRGFGRLKRRRR